MNRGYIKLWRKAQDSASWGRGLMYQGLMINLLARAAWKKGSYKGRDILPGQFGTVLKLLADTLNVPKTTLYRMVSHLEEDGFLKAENVGNQFTLITIVNWQLYQEQEKTPWNANGTQTERKWNANGTPSYIEEEVKKEELNTEGGVNARAHVAHSVPESNPEALPHAPDGPKRTDSPSKGTPEWRAFLNCWDVYPVKQGQEDAWREWMRLKANGTLARAWEIRDAILRLSGEDSRWQRGKVPKMAKWLSGKGWDDEPYIEPAPTFASAVRDGPPAARTQFQKNKQDLEGLAAFVGAADKEFANGFTPENRNGTGPHGHALPASPGQRAGAAPDGRGMDRALPGHPG